MSIVYRDWDNVQMDSLAVLSALTVPKLKVSSMPSSWTVADPVFHRRNAASWGFQWAARKPT